MSLISVDFKPTTERLPRTGSGAVEDDFSYHQRRAEEELAMAQSASHPDARRFHYHLAALHLDRAHAEAGGLRQRRVA